MDDILTGETFPEKVGEEAAAIRQVVNKAEIYIPSGKYPGPRKEGQTLSAEIEHKETVKFLTEELKKYQSLGPGYSRTPFTAEWDFCVLL